MILNKLQTPPPRDRCLRSGFAYVTFLCVLLSCIYLLGIGDYSPLERISVITSADVSFRSPQPQSYKHALKNVIPSGDNKYNTNNGSRSQIPEMCSDIFSIGKTRSTMTPLAKSVVSNIRRVKYDRKFRPFLRQEPYIILGDMMPVMFNSSTTCDNDTSKIFNKVWRMEQVAGLFPHLSCRLRDYSTAMLKQCLVNRRRRGKGTKLLFMGDSRVRQYVEVFLDVFRDMDFEITTHEGEVLTIDEFIGPAFKVRKSKYQKPFIAEVKRVRNFQIEFYWTEIFDLHAPNGDKYSTNENPNAFELLKQNTNNTDLREVRIGTSRKPILFSKNTSATTKNHRVEFKSRKTIHQASTQIMDAHYEHSNNMSTTSSKMLFEENQTRFKKVVDMENVVKPVNAAPFKGKPLERLEKLLTLATTEVPEMVILGTGAWALANADSILRVLDNIPLRQVAQLRPLLLRLRTVTQLVWIMPLPFDEHVYTTNNVEVHYDAPNLLSRNMEWVADAQVQLMAQGVTVWDSFYPLAHASQADCVKANDDHCTSSLPRHPRLGFMKSWLCGDRVHTSNEAHVAAAQMVANQLCNEYMPHQGYCCEK